MKRTNHLFYAVLCTCVLFAIGSCKNKSTQPSSTAQTDSVVHHDTLKAIKDSTLYGVSTEDFGMSTFSMVSDKGDTLQLVRDHNDGTPAKIYGDLDYYAHYALTTCDNNQSVGTLINVDQLKKFVPHYKLWNCRLVFAPQATTDTFDVVSLDSKALVYKDKTGKQFTLKKK